MKDILRHQCINVKNVTDCIVNRTFELSEVVGNAWIGGVSKTSLMDPSFWIPDFTWVRDGRCYTLNYSKNVADDYEKDIMMFGSTDPNKHQVIYIHDASFFAISDNPKAFSMKRTKAMNNTFLYIRISLVQHKLLNRPENACEEKLPYSFLSCIKNTFSKTVGCRLPWDRWSDQKQPLCTSLDQFRQFEELYGNISSSATEGVEKATGCKKPCQYYEYRTLGVPTPSSFPHNNVTSYFGLWYVSTETVMEVETWVYPWTSLVAEFGGTLGLFLGFSFMTVWDGAVFGSNSLNKWWKNKNLGITQ